MEVHVIPTRLGQRGSMILGLGYSQTLGLMLGVAVAFMLYNTLSGLSTPLAVGVAALAVLCSLAGVYIRPHGMNLAEWSLVLRDYYSIPRSSVWEPEGFGPPSHGGDAEAEPEAAMYYDGKLSWD